MVKSILQRIFSRGESLPPDLLRSRLKMKFSNAINESWLHNGGQWEVVFHDHSRERIARFNRLGDIEELRTNTPLSELPGHILQALKERGEIMNAITIENKGQLTYELIYRNDSLERFLINLEEGGNEISCSQL